MDEQRREKWEEFDEMDDDSGFELEEDSKNYKEDQVENHYQGNNLSKEQKIGIAFLGIMLIVVVIFWSAQFKKNLEINLGGGQYSPESNVACEGPSCPDYIAKLKLMDTDGDGLSDYDELYIYNTSPYLVDTDGDGISDYDEVMAGTDPNCPAGRDCGQFNPAEIPINTNTTIPLPDFDQDLNLNNPSATNDQVNIKELRSILVQNGMDENILNLFSDEELLGVYKEVFNSQQ
jgi:hypothetical protein